MIFSTPLEIDIFFRITSKNTAFSFKVYVAHNINRSEIYKYRFITAQYTYYSLITYLKLLQY